jgi:hypothetical protein
MVWKNRHALWTLGLLGVLTIVEIPFLIFGGRVARKSS